jgi:hypothetical protein
VAIVEESTRWRRDQPWTRTTGLVVTAVIFVLGCLLIAFGTYHDGHFMAHPAQLAVSALVVGALVAAAFTLPRRPSGRRADHEGVAPEPAGVPSPWLLLGGTLAAGVAVIGSQAVSAWVAVPVLLAVEAAVVVAVLVWSRRAGWGRWHRFAPACGALLTYAWHAFTMRSVIGDSSATLDLVSHIIFAAVTLLIIWYAAKRIRHDDVTPV